MKNWKEFNESLYESEPQKEKKCPDCGSVDADLLGPKDYKRDEHGNYRRTIGYKCNKCGCIYDVDKK